MDNLIERLNEIAEEKLEYVKQELMVSISEANFKIVRARVRGGKIQRKRKVATRPGYTIRGGKLVRMSSQERLKRKMQCARAKPSARQRWRVP